jgi:hypothetical protein
MTLTVNCPFVLWCQVVSFFGDPASIFFFIDFYFHLFETAKAQTRDSLLCPGEVNCSVTSYDYLRDSACARCWGTQVVVLIFFIPHVGEQKKTDRWRRRNGGNVW